MIQKDPRIGRPVQRNVQVEGTWYRIGQVPLPAHARKITNPRVWGDDMGDVPGPGQFETDENGKVVPPSGQPIEKPEGDQPLATSQDEAQAEQPKRKK